MDFDYSDEFCRRVNTEKIHIVSTNGNELNQSIAIWHQQTQTENILYVKVPSVEFHHTPHHTLDLSCITFAC